MKTIFFVLGCLLLSSCADTGAAYSEDGPGFWMGLWHGLIAVPALIGHLFDSSIRVYASPNNGGWYDFGFLFGVGSWTATKRLKDEANERE